MFLEELPTVLYEQQNLKTLGEILAFYPETWLPVYTQESHRAHTLGF